MTNAYDIISNLSLENGDFTWRLVYKCSPGKLKFLTSSNYSRSCQNIWHDKIFRYTGENVARQATTRHRISLIHIMFAADNTQRCWNILAGVEVVKHLLVITSSFSAWTLQHNYTCISPFKQNLQGWPKKQGHWLMTIILSNFNLFKNFSL